MKIFSTLAVSFLAATTTLAQIPPFHLMVFGDNPATNGSFVKLRPVSDASSGPAVAVVGDSSPALIARVRNGEVQSLTFDKATKKYTRLGPIAGLHKVKTTGPIQREALVFRDIAGASAEFNRTSNGFYLDAPPGERAYFLYHRVKPEIVNGFMICKTAGQTYYSVFYYEYKKGSPTLKGCEFVGLAVQQAK